jgi:hypothetical protein
MNVEGRRKEAGRHEKGEGLKGKRGDGRRHRDGRRHLAKGYLSRFLGTYALFPFFLIHVSFGTYALLAGVVTY